MHPTSPKIAVDAPTPSASLASALNKFPPILFRINVYMYIYRLNIGILLIMFMQYLPR